MSSTMLLADARPRRMTSSIARESAMEFPNLIPLQKTSMSRVVKADLEYDLTDARDLLHPQSIFVKWYYPRRPAPFMGPLFEIEIATYQGYGSWRHLPQLYFAKSNATIPACMLLMEDLSNRTCHEQRGDANPDVVDRVINFMAKLHAMELRPLPNVEEMGVMSQRGIHSVRLNEKDSGGSCLPYHFSYLYQIRLPLKYEPTDDTWGSYNPTNLKHLSEEHASSWKDLEALYPKIQKYFKDAEMTETAFSKIRDSNFDWATMFSDCVTDLSENMHRTIVHGDFRIENILFGDEDLKLVDWQGASIGPGSIDLATFIVHCASPKDRRQNESKWIEQYATTLNQSRKKSEAIPLEEITRGYRNGVMIELNFATMVVGKAWVNAPIEAVAQIGRYFHLLIQMVEHAIIAFADHYC
eukprot:TRINITY_DN4423_c0_g1_i1.p1 TRINITY_DN4423_c0_g1~~TRINITY_DN4423_c0_g1_i1.p1  ORF type:complete len:412 (-),score=83.18 TRINITY_DN4423_c0_g1_i1:65-1300(-)